MKIFLSPRQCSKTENLKKFSKCQLPKTGLTRNNQSPDEDPKGEKPVESRDQRCAQ